MNYDKHGDTLILSPCANEKLPEATLTDIVRNNSADLNSITYVVNNLYRHLYGEPKMTNVPDVSDPECFRDEIVEQSRKLVAINEKLALICTKLGV